MGRHAKFPVTNTNRGWLVNVPPSSSETGKRQQRYFQTREKATDFAKNLRESKKEFGERSRALAPGVADDAARALDLLQESGVTLSEAARFYVFHHDLRAKAPTLEEAWKRAKALRDNLSDRYRSTLKNWERRLPADFATKNIVDISPADISSALSAMTNGPVAWKSGLRVISAVLGDEVKHGSLKENPCSRVVTPKGKTEDEVRLYTVKELQALFAACRQYDSGMDRNCEDCSVPFAFLAFAGIRPTELTRLTWDDVNLDLASIRIGGKISKTGKTRNVRIHPTLRAWIETIPKDKRSGRIIPGRWRYKATRVRTEAGLDGRVLQDALRHSYGSYMLATENDLNALNADMGHQHCQVFFDHYHNAMTKEEAAPYWKTLPPEKES